MTERSFDQERELDDEGVVIKAKQDPRIFEVLYERYYQRIYRFLALRTSSRELAEDLASETFLKAFKALEKFEPKRPFAAWIFTIARNLLIDTYRKSGRVVRMNEDLPMGYDAGIEEKVEKELQRDALANSLSKLTDTEREIITLRISGDLSHQEIARVLGKSEAAVKMGYMRALNHLKQIFHTS